MADAGLADIRGCGQAIWLHGMRRLLAGSDHPAGGMGSYGVTGATTDLVALAGALVRGPEYATTLRGWAADAQPLPRPAEALLVEEATIAARGLEGAYEQSGGRDGYAGLIVDPALAQDAEALSLALRRLDGKLEPVNVLPELPATDSGIAVFEALTAEGRSVHIGPVHSIAAVERITEAFVRGLRRLAETGDAAPRPASVLAFGLATLDESIDESLLAAIRSADDDTSRVESLLGSVATAVAKVACRRHRDLLAARLAGDAEASRWLRLMWCDLVTGDPRRRRLRYVEGLAGPDTVCLMPRGLIRDAAAARIEPALGRRVDEAEEIVAEIAGLGIDLDAIADRLSARHLELCRRHYAELDNAVIEAVDALGRRAGAGVVLDRGTPPWRDLAEIDDALVAGADVDPEISRRLWDKDATLWSSDPDVAERIRNRLGWLDLLESPLPVSRSMRAFAEEGAEGDIEEVVVIGLGGSSLCADVCRRVFGVERVWIADSTVPARVSEIAAAVDPARTLVVVASKSGTTPEVTALLDFFYARATPMLERPGDRFVAITDPGTPLEQTSHERGFRRLWLAPADVGGRFSALSVFGTLPMELMGIDSEAIRDAARRMAASCAAGTAASHNPGTRLGIALYEAHQAGRDKLTFVGSPSLGAFALWAEQLVAESTGKEGLGLVPIVDEPRIDADDYADDRFFVSLRLAEDDDPGHDDWLDQLGAAGHPVVRFVLQDRHQLGAEFARWQIAIATAGALLGINPFDQPDVQASKDRTAELLAAHAEGTPMSDRPPVANDTGWAVFADLDADADLAERQVGSGLDAWMSAHLGRARVPEYVALQAFMAPTSRAASALGRIRRLLLERRGAATTLGWGPAFLHSTGQLHKGGPETGIFLQITVDDGEDIDVPGAGYSFGRLVRAQSLGDLAALEERGRRVVRVHLNDPDAGAETLLEAVDRGVT